MSHPLMWLSTRYPHNLEYSIHNKNYDNSRWMGRGNSRLSTDTNPFAGISLGQQYDFVGILANHPTTYNTFSTLQPLTSPIPTYSNTLERPRFSPTSSSNDLSMTHNIFLRVQQLTTHYNPHFSNLLLCFRLTNPIQLFSPTTMNYFWRTYISLVMYSKQCLFNHRNTTTTA